MALIRVDFFSKALMRTVTINAVVPTDKMVFGSTEPPKPKKYKTLYLLHGIFGNYTDWVTGTRIQAWAQDKDLVVIMPSGENKCYVDNEKSGDMFGKFIGEELVDFTRRTFPLSDKREDTFIGGLSMGGYGAIRNGLKYHDTFGAICDLSSALILEGVYKSEYQEKWSIGSRHYYEGLFGDIDKLPGSDKDYNALAKKVAEEGKNIPKIYMACGTEDNLVKANDAFSKYLTELGIEHTYETGPGVHNWVFWDTYIAKVLDWLPLGEAEAGISSGNVKG